MIFISSLNVSFFKCKVRLVFNKCVTTKKKKKKKAKVTNVHYPDQPGTKMGLLLSEWFFLCEDLGFIGSSVSFQTLFTFFSSFFFFPVCPLHLNITNKFQVINNNSPSYPSKCLSLHFRKIRIMKNSP